MYKTPLYFEITINVITVLFFIGEGLCLQKLYNKFLQPRSRFMKRLGAVAFWTAFMSLSFYLSSNDSEAQLIVKLFIYLVGLTVFTAVFYKGNFLERILPAVIFASVRELVLQGANCLTGLNVIAGDIIIDHVNDGSLGEGAVTLSYISTLAVLFIVGTVRVVSIYFVVTRINKSLRFTGIAKREAAVYFLPPVSGYVVSMFMRVVVLTFHEDKSAELIYSMHPMSYIVMPLVSVSMLAMIVFVYRLCQDMAETQREKAERVILQNQIVQMQDSLNETERLYDSIRSVRHDMKNNIAVLRELISGSSSPKEIQAYFEEMDNAVERLDSRVKTGSAVCDSIITAKFDQAEKLLPDIELSADDFIFINDNIKPYDVAIILNNALDNAIEACVRMREKSPDKKAYISLRSFIRKNMYFIEMVNSYDGELYMKNGELPSTSKADKDAHGIGLRNIKKCAEKYYGGVDISADDGKFTLNIMMKYKNLFS